ncbi:MULTISPECIES: helix-turn-helix transcriptional regulator [Chryseobacterium]|uniref:AraC-like DNA-binding protein n=1 Tax=Chryseobacterium camelliae TaxID=1265445 RepID=A0ABU0TH06_9FLAO|nr:MULTISPECIES: helix-turn-helix transcriptional regulator [Chryseobacterium]MDT3405853.1 AraC-like DNA-binding protein [Pseudacidovorax intermedius]MDQ1096340.1 AraC-like DNA-binding protein [Chryseobacterium camelliae]MDQ1100279.1 AraC-like DNA-binding protein [Chryseobacterium sp. SORGH_AS_1048]MDR6087622.1 AraC-like DNA-binding protein [Chryseobacterium sp. SORGH_AS_0909]MDR6131996.1 AraC-like DNA-binding protein [Chryseobacterium sp. SORGH_AS_1175]
MQNCKNVFIERQNLQDRSFTPYTEKQHSIITDSEGSFSFFETSFNHLQFIECSYQFHDEEQICIDIENEVLEMHFRLQGSSSIQRENTSVELHQANNMLTFQKDSQQKVHMRPVQDGYFYEIRIGISHFEKLMSDFYQPSPEYFSGTPLQITPEMRLLLSQMTRTAYTGHMKSLFLEAKMTELFLLQLQQNRTLASGRSMTIRNSEKDKFQYAKQLIEHHTDQFLTVSELAQQSGLTPRKLMQGFKELFGCTVYQHIKHVKMQTARTLLMDTDKHINEIARDVGYQNAQHFITAFKRNFGISPGKMKH